MFKRVLVTLDGSEAAEAILPFLLEIAGPLDMRLTLLRVVEPMPPVASEGRLVVLEDVEQRRLEAEAYLAAIARPLRRRGIEVDCEVRRGRPVDEILDVTRAVGADLIAMTTHGRSGLRRLLFGSVAEAVLREADVPVFLMRQTAAQPAAATA